MQNTYFPQLTNWLLKLHNTYAASAKRPYWNQPFNGLTSRHLAAGRQGDERSFLIPPVSPSFFGVSLLTIACSSVDWDLVVDREIVRLLLFWGEERQSGEGRMRVNADEDPISAQELAELRKRLKLSPHQTEIVTHVVHGRSYEQIAGEMGISMAVLRTHLSGLFRKFDVHDRAELILHLTAAVRSGNENHKK